MAGTLFLVLYVLLALVNYPIVQSVAGSFAGQKLSQAWGGEVHIGSIGINLLDHVALYDIRLISPTDDTIFIGEKISVRFNGIPITSEGLTLERVAIRNADYHLGIDSTGINLNYIIKQFGKSEKKKESKPFAINVSRIRLRNVHYHMDLPSTHDSIPQEHGVVIPHMDYHAINARIRSLCIEEGRITCRMEEFSTHEQSGLNINKLSFDADVGPKGIVANNLLLETDSTHLEADLQLRYHSWESMKHFLDSVDLYANIKPGSVASMATPAYWAPVLWGMNTRIQIEGVVSGPVADLHAENMIIRFGYGSELFFDGFITGLPDMRRTIISGDVERLTTNYSDLNAVRHPDGTHVTTLPILQKMGQIDIAAKFYGTIYDFVASATVNSTLGMLMAETSLKWDSTIHSYQYKGEVSSPSLLVNKIAQNDWVSSSGFSLAFEGKDFNPSRMTASLEGRLFNSQVRGKQISESNLDVEMNQGKAVAWIHIADSLVRINLSAEADIAEAPLQFKSDIELQHIDCTALHLWNNENDSIVQLASEIGLSGSLDLTSPSPLESLLAAVQLQNTHIVRNNQEVTIQDLKLETSYANQRKQIRLESDIVDAEVSGYFEYAQIPLIVRSFCEQYLPNYYNPYLRQNSLEPTAYDAIADANMEIDVHWTDPKHKASLLLPSISIAPNTRLHGNYNFVQSLKLVATSDSIKLGSICLYDFGLNSGDLSGRYLANLEADHFAIGATSLLERVRLQLASTSDQASCSLHWLNSETDTTRGDLQLTMHSDINMNRISVARSRILIHGNRWRLTTDDDILFANNFIVANGVQLRGKDQHFFIDIDKRGAESDSLSVDFQRFDLGQISFLLNSNGFDLDGIIDGHLSMRGFNETPYLDAKLKIDEWVVNEQPLGDATIVSNWNAGLNQLNLDLSSQLHTESGSRIPLSAKGYVGLGEKTPTLNFEVGFDKFSLLTLAPLVRSFSSQLEGNIAGNFLVEGTTKEPVIQGGLRINEGIMKVDFLNVPFYIDDSITLTRDKVLFDHFTIKDALGQTAVLNGAISHNGLKDIQFDLGLTTNNILVMNSTPQQGDFYGRILAAAEGRITGTDKHMDIVVDATTRPGSNIAFPISNKRQVQSLSYIQFVDDLEEWKQGISTAEKSKAEKSSSAFGYALTINLNVTPDVKVLLPMDLSTVSADVTATGEGALQLSLSSNAGFALLGNYEIGNGSMSLNLLGLITKDFTIDQGSSINFTGSISDAILDIDALYSQRVNLATLTGVSASTDRSSQVVPVQNVIEVTGTLNSPVIGFDLRLPNVDPSVSEEVFSYIDRTNDRDMLNQTMNLLVFGSFYNSTTSNSTSIGNSGYSLVANSVGSVVSDLVQFVDVNFDYTAESELTNQQLDVDISKEWGKFYLESTLGIGESNNLSGNNNNNNITGDVLLGYKIRPNIHFFVFNRSNTNDYTRSDLPYKQGLGLKYTKDFNRFSDLLKKSDLKKRKK